MSCSLCQLVERQRARVEPRASSAIRVDRAALNRALGGRGELLEADELRATGRPTVNAGRMWNLLTANLYQSGDLPVIATREALQNSLDAIRAAIRARQIRAEEGRFEVALDLGQEDWSITWADNGIGMDADTIVGKFLSLGDTGKADAADSAEASGGFGVAKAVILGISESFRWEMHTRDNLAVAKGRGRDVEVFAAARRQGTRITVHGLKRDVYWHYDWARKEDVKIEERIAELLGANDLPGVAILFQGREVEPLFKRRGGSRVRVEADWGPGTTASVKAYRRGPGDTHGAYYVRLNGLFQFKVSSRRIGIPADIVIDLHTTTRPGQPGYPVNAARDALQEEARRAFDALVEEVEAESLSAARAQEDEVFDDFDGAGGVGQELRASLSEAMTAPDVAALLRSAAGGLVDFYRERATARTVAPAESRAPAGSDHPEHDPLLGSGPLGPGLGGVAAALTHEPARGGAVRSTVVAGIREQLNAGQQTLRANGKGRVLVTVPVEAALQSIEDGQATQEDLDAVALALQDAAEAAILPGGGGLMAAAAMPQTLTALQEATGKRIPPRGLQNPFAGFAALRVSKKNYDRAKARRFVKSYARWTPYLLLWDATLRLIANEARIRRGFASGFVLDDTLNGLAAMSTDKRRIIIYCHPDRLAEAVKAHPKRPIAVAAYLHSLAVHELTHADGRMGMGHNEEFSSARENLGRATAHLLPPLAALAVKLLGLTPDPESGEARAERLAGRVAHLELLVKRAREEAAVAKRRVRALERTLEARDAPPPTHGTPGTRLGWSDLGGWLAAWRAIEARPASAAHHRAREAHLEALPDDLVMEAPVEDLDRLESLIRALKPQRGHRLGHPTTRLQDASDRARTRERGIEARMGSDRADALLSAIKEQARAQLPEGLSEEDLESFLRRHERTLRWRLANAFGRRT